MPRDVVRRAGLIALLPALFATGLLMSREGRTPDLAGWLVAGFLFLVFWGLSYVAVLLIGLFGRWIEPEGHMDHVTHCGVCQSREVPIEGHYSSNSSA